MRSLVVLPFVVLAAMAACGGDDADGTSGSSGTSTSSGGTSSGGTSSGASGTSTSSGSDTTSGGAAGARGLVDCDGESVDLSSDARHCGACDHACAEGELCVDRVCNSGASCVPAGGFDTCGGQCRRVLQDVDHCGGCDKACGDDERCVGGACRNVLGTGASCESPVAFDDDDDIEVWFGAAKHRFECGALEDSPAVFLRWTSDKATKVRARVLAAPEDQMVIEVFEAGAECKGAPMACDTQRASTTRAEAEFTAAANKTYFVVVGTLAKTAPLGRFTVKMDD